MKYLLCVFLALMGCAENPPPLCQVQTQGSNVYVHSYGDSITAGAGTASIQIGQNTTSSNFCDGYQALFTAAIKANADNEAISGSTFTSVNEYNRMMALNQEGPDDINTLLPGFNDVSQYGSDQPHLDLFQTDLTVALTHTASMGKMTLVGTTLYMTAQMQIQFWPLHTNANVDLYVTVIKQVVNQLQSQGLPIYLVDTNAIYDPNTMSSNNYHPDNYGHQILAQAFLSVYQGAL